MKKIIYVLSLLSVTANAVGVLTFNAKVESFDEKNITVVMKDGRTIKFPKAKLSEDQQKELKVNSTITLGMNEKEIAGAVVTKKK